VHGAPMSRFAPTRGARWSLRTLCCSPATRFADRTRARDLRDAPTWALRCGVAAWRSSVKIAPRRSALSTAEPRTTMRHRVNPRRETSFWDRNELAIVTMIVIIVIVVVIPIMVVVALRPGDEAELRPDLARPSHAVEEHDAVYPAVAGISLLGVLRE